MEYKSSIKHYIFINCANNIIGIHATNPTFDFLHIGNNTQNGVSFCNSRKYGTFWISNEHDQIIQSAVWNHMNTNVVVSLEKKFKFDNFQMIPMDKMDKKEIEIKHISKFNNVIFDEGYGISGRLLINCTVKYNKSESSIFYQLFNHNELLPLKEYLENNDYFLMPGTDFKPFNLIVYVFEMLYGSDLINSLVQSPDFNSVYALPGIDQKNININNKQNKPNEEMNNIRRRLNEWNNEINFDIMIEEEILSGILSTLKDKASNAYNFIKKTGGNIKSVSSVLGAVISPGSVSNEKNLLDIHKKQDYKWNENGELKDKKISISDNGPNLIMNGKGNIELGVGYHIDLAIDLEYKMDWDLKNGLIEIQIVIYGYFDIGAYFNAKLNGEFDIQINDLLKIAPKFTFFLGPIPITVQPYIHLKARFKALDLMINAGLDCTYKEMFVLGYRIDSKAGPAPIISLIIDKYEYIMDTIYKIKLKTLSECAKAMFKYGTGPHQQAILCKYFDYNHETRECRCKGADDDTPKLKANIATEAYVLGSECQVDKKLISIKRDGCLEIVSGLKTNINSKYICMSCQRKHIDIVEEKMENKPIMDRKEIIKECKKTLHTNGMDLSDINKCQVTTLGFDVMIRPILGIELMNLADVHLIFQMDIPLRFEIPEMRSNICPSIAKQEGNGDVCLTQTYLKTSFSISGVLSVSLGYGLRLGPILRSLLSKFIKIGSLSQPTIKKLGEKKFEKIGCLEFKGNLIKLNKFYKKRCCDANGVKKVYRVKSHSILNEPLDGNNNYKNTINEKLLNQYKNKGIFAEYPLEVKKEWGQLLKKGVESFDKKELFDMLLKSGPFHEFFKEQNENENENENKQIVVNAGRQDIYNMIDNYIYEIENNKWINKLGHNDYYKQRKKKKN
eukprot:38191_1